MDQTPHAIRKENVDLTRFDNRGYFALTERWMQHVLPSTVSAHAIVWSAHLDRRAARGAALMGHPRAAYRATYAGDLSLLAQGSHDVPALFTALYAHLLDSISNGEYLYLFLFHSAPPFDTGRLGPLIKATISSSGPTWSERTN